MNKFKVKTPIGYLMVEAKGAKNEYPGVYIGFSKDGVEYYKSHLIACVEYDTCSDEILIETYSKDYEEPNHIMVWDDGRDKL